MIENAKIRVGNNFFAANFNYEGDLLQYEAENVSKRYLFQVSGSVFIFTVAQMV